MISVVFFCACVIGIVSVVVACPSFAVIVFVALFSCSVILPSSGVLSCVVTLIVTLACVPAVAVIGCIVSFGVFFVTVIVFVLVVGW